MNESIHTEGADVRAGETAYLRAKETDLQGSIIFRSESDISVRIISPFYGLETGCHIPYFARHVSSFAGSHGDETAQSLLRNLFEVGVFIERNWPSVQTQYLLTKYFVDANCTPGPEDNRLAVRKKEQNAFSAWFDFITTGLPHSVDADSLKRYIEDKIRRDQFKQKDIPAGFKKENEA